MTTKNTKTIELNITIPYPVSTESLIQITKGIEMMKKLRQDYEDMQSGLNNPKVFEHKGSHPSLSACYDQIMKEQPTFEHSEVNTFIQNKKWFDKWYPLTEAYANTCKCGNKNWEDCGSKKLDKCFGALIYIEYKMMKIYDAIMFEKNIDDLLKTFKV